MPARRSNSSTSMRFIHSGTGPAFGLASWNFTRSKFINSVRSKKNILLLKGIFTIIPTAFYHERPFWRVQTCHLFVRPSERKFNHTFIAQPLQSEINKRHSKLQRFTNM